MERLGLIYLLARCHCGESGHNASDVALEFALLTPSQW